MIPQDKVIAVLKKFEDLELKMSQASSDPAQMTVLGKERKKLEPSLLLSQEWLKMTKELDALNEMSKESDPGMQEMAKHEREMLLPKLEETDKKLKRLLFPPDPRADRDSIIEIRAGAGGDEAGLFVADLYRMYSKYALNKGLEVSVYSVTPTGVGGLKEVVFSVAGPNAYGLFRFEQGVHRVQRVPETEAQGRIHTSTVTVAVLPEATEVDIKVDPRDLKIDTYRAGGAGGQHVNKTESAIRITHIPSGVVVACQEERSQGQNRLRAMTLLRTRLQEDAESKIKKAQSDMRRKQVGTGDRSEKIRTYNFPQDRITDHRINHSVHNIHNVLEGDMDDLINALLAHEEKLRQDD